MIGLVGQCCEHLDLTDSRVAKLPGILVKLTLDASRVLVVARQEDSGHVDYFAVVCGAWMPGGALGHSDDGRQVMLIGTAWLIVVH